jgi:uncharacterized protein
MRLDDIGQSENLEDRRGDPDGFSSGGSGGGRSFGGGGGSGRLGIGAMIALGLLGWATGINPMLLISGAEMVQGLRGGGQVYEHQMPAPRARTSQTNDEMGIFVSKVLRANEDVWTKILPAQTNIAYAKPRLVLFNRVTQSGCGEAESATGPFYCPADRKIYLDTSFFDEMTRRFGGGGKFAEAYVISHEIGHHVENLLGILPKVAAQQRRVDQRTANALSVRVELMADCLAGVWAYEAKAQLGIDEADVKQAMATASAIGDDRLQQQSRGRVVPDSFTHGSSEQRMRWFSQGWTSGSINQCNTFQASQL